MLISGNRTTPSYVAFTDTERLIGDAAKNQVAMNPENTENTVFGKSVAGGNICKISNLSSRFQTPSDSSAASSTTSRCRRT